MRQARHCKESMTAETKMLQVDRVKVIVLNAGSGMSSSNAMPGGMVEV